MGDDLFLAVGTDHGEDFSDVEVDVLVDTGEVAGFAGEGVAGM